MHRRGASRSSCPAMPAFGRHRHKRKTGGLAQYSTATSLQVTAAVLGGVIWAMENPRAGVVEADSMDHAGALEIMLPYLGTMAGEYSSRAPL